MQILIFEDFFTFLYYRDSPGHGSNSQFGPLLPTALPSGHSFTSIVHATPSSGLGATIGVASGCCVAGEIVGEMEDCGVETGPLLTGLFVPNKYPAISAATATINKMLIHTNVLFCCMKCSFHSL
jgi:hypothetical protein